MAFCTQCGSKLEDNALFCSNCGSHVRSSSTTTQSGEAPNGFYSAQPFPTADKITEVVQKLYKLEMANVVAWSIIVVYQACLGIRNLSIEPGSAIFLLLLAAFNGYATYKTYLLTRQLLTVPPQDLVIQYEKNLWDIIITGIAMLFLAPIGVLGAIYDFYIRYYALSHRSELELYIQDRNSNINQPQ